MRNTKLSTSFIFLCFAVFACKKPTIDLNDYGKFADSSFTSADYGELPALPANLGIKEGSFISFLSQAGEFKQAIAKEDTTVFIMNDGKKSECKILKGEKVYVVASVETEDQTRLAIIQPAKPCLFQNPRINELIPISEGYTDLGQLAFIADDTNVKSIAIGIAANKTPVLVGAGKGCVRMTQTFNGKECGVGGDSKCALPGTLLRSGAVGFILKITGTAPRWVVTVAKLEGGGSKPTPRRLFDSSQLAKTPDGGAALIPMAALLGVTSDWSFATVRFSGQAATSDGVPFGPICTHQFYAASPLVLDFSQTQRPLRSLPLEHSVVKFDLDGSGSKKHTGWIYPYTGFLALDRNQNGIIDHGGELFGQYTQVSDKLNRFGNGFLALKLYDSNGDGFVDANDKIFKHLLIWQDKNMDGVSQASELRSLASMQVSRIATRFETKPIEKNMFSNQAPFVAKFWGPKYCGDKGCHIYDIFFKASDSFELTGVVHDRH